jgi:hypothetical protein
MKRSSHTIQLTDAQTATLKMMPKYSILQQFSNGAVVITFKSLRSAWTVIDTLGKAYSFEKYLSFLD